MQKIENKPCVEKISSTALFVSYARRYSDIPYAGKFPVPEESQEIYERMMEQNIAGAGFLTILYEARYKNLRKVLREIMENENIHNIIEIASGSSSHGLEESENSDIIYVETDLPDMISEKEEKCTEILHNRKEERRNLYFASVNALKKEEMLATLNLVSEDGPIMVTNEGLLSYFDNEDKAKIAKNIKAIVEKRGGVWVTADTCVRFPPPSDIDMKTIFRGLAKTTERKIREKAFVSIEESIAFFEDFGFEVERRLYDMSDLRSVSLFQETGVNVDAIIENMSHREIFILRLKK
jgi:O-methyltransferase involved in polyketide biosynthesis